MTDKIEQEKKAKKERAIKLLRAKKAKMKQEEIIAKSGPVYFPTSHKAQGK